MLRRLFCRASRPTRRYRVPLFAASALLAIAALPLSARADEADSQFWSVFTFNARFPNRLRLYAEVQPRIGNNYHEISQLIIRPAIGYQVTPKLSLWGGYGWTPSFLPKYTSEHRVFQQALIENNFPGLAMQNRTRLEERSIQGAGGLAWRIRHQVRVSKPLNATKRWAAVGYNELFWNLNSTPHGPQSGFDQDRVYLGTAYNTDRHTRVELGYLASFVNPPNNRPNRRLDVLLLGVNYNL
jgi:hypothetical protein